MLFLVLALVISIAGSVYITAYASEPTLSYDTYLGARVITPTGTWATPTNKPGSVYAYTLSGSVVGNSATRRGSWGVAGEYIELYSYIFQPYDSSTGEFYSADFSIEFPYPDAYFSLRKRNFTHEECIASSHFAGLKVGHSGSSSPIEARLYVEYSFTPSTGSDSGETQTRTILQPITLNLANSKQGQEDWLDIGAVLDNIYLTSPNTDIRYQDCVITKLTIKVDSADFPSGGTPDTSSVTLRLPYISEARYNDIIGSLATYLGGASGIVLDRLEQEIYQLKVDKKDLSDRLAETDALRQQLQEDYDTLESYYNDLSAENTELKSLIAELEEDIAFKTELINELDVINANLELQITDLELQIVRLQNQLPQEYWKGYDQGYLDGEYDATISKFGVVDWLLDCADSFLGLELFSAKTTQGDTYSVTLRTLLSISIGGMAILWVLKVFTR